MLQKYAYFTAYQNLKTPKACLKQDFSSINPELFWVVKYSLLHRNYLQLKIKSVAISNLCILAF